MVTFAVTIAITGVELWSTMVHGIPDALRGYDVVQDRRQSRNCLTLLNILPKILIFM